MDRRNLLLKYLQEDDDSEEEMEEMEAEGMQELTFMLASLEEEGSSQRGGPTLPREVVPRDHHDGHRRIWADYFALKPVYGPRKFRRRFRMARHVFLRLVNACERTDPSYFVQKPDCTGLLGLSPLQKCIASIRILAYGVPGDSVDEYVRIGESTAVESLRHFCRAIIYAFGEYYLRAPNESDVEQLFAEGEKQGFPGMLGSIDCMHWEWRNCPTAWKGMFTGRGKSPTMILEAVASHNLWIWHAYFGMPGSCNDINVLNRSPIFSRYMRGQPTLQNFTINGHAYDMGYYLADGIYPDWPSFVKSVRHPMSEKTRHFAAMQEGARKAIERAFGVLQTRWAVIRGPAYGWDKDAIGEIMTACIIMHNMIIEDEGDDAFNMNFDKIGVQADVSTGILADRDAFVRARHKLHDSKAHHQLQADLIEHLWQLRGSS